MSQKEILMFIDGNKNMDKIDGIREELERNEGVVIVTSNYKHFEKIIQLYIKFLESELDAVSRRDLSEPENQSISDLKKRIDRKISDRKDLSCTLEEITSFLSSITKNNYILS